MQSPTVSRPPNFSTPGGDPQSIGSIGSIGRLTGSGRKCKSLWSHSQLEGSYNEWMSDSTVNKAFDFLSPTSDFDFNEGWWWHPCQFILVPCYNFSQKEIRIMIIFIVRWQGNFQQRQLLVILLSHLVDSNPKLGQVLDWLWWVCGAYRRRTTGDGADHPPPTM